jgi:hypothetical protein
LLLSAVLGKCDYKELISKIYGLQQLQLSIIETLWFMSVMTVRTGKDAVVFLSEKLGNDEMDDDDISNVYEGKGLLWSQKAR